MSRFNLKPLVLLLLASIVSCAKPDVNDSSNSNSDPTEEVINIPEGFDYSTSHEVTVTISDNSNAIYEVFATSDIDYFVETVTYEDEEGNTVTEDIYRDDIINKQVMTGVAVDGTLVQSITLPKYCDKVYIRRKDNLQYSGEMVDVINNQINYTFQESAGRTAALVAKNGVIDYFYCVNGYGNLFQVDPLDGSYTLLSEMPMGSWTAAIDQDNKALYSIGYAYPHPLMRYDIETDVWTIVDNLYGGGPRLEFNSNDGLLYFSTHNVIYTINPNNGDVLQGFYIEGLHYTGGGDLVFADDGTLFLCTHGGLYRLTLDANNVYQSERISAESLPFSPTSLTFDSNGDLWLAGNDLDGNLIIMDTVTGSWQYIYGVNAGNGTNFNRPISDLTTFRIFPDTPDTTDTDGDGVVDSQDAFPTEAEKAFEIFTPSKFGTGTIAFEDLWPSYGDYDFNDVAINYKAIAVLNSNNEAVQIDFITKVKSNGAGFTNGFGIELEGVPSSMVESVTGAVYSHNYINLNANGTEANQQNAVIIFTDDQDNFLNETTISVVFTQPISTSQLGTAPFNPFLIRNMVRSNEIHLPYGNTTDLGGNIQGFNGVNRDPDGDYISDTGFPWAISVIHDFKVPKENVRIYNAYNRFNDWATSGGNSFADWYKDNPGNRNSNLLKN